MTARLTAAPDSAGALDSVPLDSVPASAVPHFAAVPDFAIPPKQRKRGAALEDAILAAAYDELSEVGYTAFAVEAVAARAQTGKASIYRRWATKQELVLDALCAVLPTPGECGLIVDLADPNLTTVQALRHVAGAVMQTLNSPAGAAIRAVKCEAFSDPELARTVDERFQAPRRAAMLAILQRGVERGEVRPEAATAIVADVLPAVIAHKVLLMREQITEQDITDIIDDVIIPLVQSR